MACGCAEFAAFKASNDPYHEPYKDAELAEFISYYNQKHVYSVVTVRKDLLLAMLDFARREGIKEALSSL